jgi:hypothetical protein
MKIPKGFKEVGCRINQLETKKETLFYNKKTKEEFILIEVLIYGG